ncbi:PREDICTED: pre T-cell antigen receptor alpha [Elephantulus edwardii]|uniref:pre T-cell antigen receptor alpha n=1 Tax=Elephantulus edwardii TaxID=28737 RepID=UPI0003F094E7|nr:PREDICTED: pre T-cell antigen receptor alpha [Elephantulus edwardii]
MAGTWLVLLLVLGCPTLPTDPISSPFPPEVNSVLQNSQSGLIATPFPSLAPPVTLLVDGKQQMLVVCLVLNVAPPGLDSPIWFSAGNGSELDAFTYGPSPAADGTWTSVAQISLPSEELGVWEPLVCHAGPGVEGSSWSTPPLKLSGEASAARTCLKEPLRGLQGQALRLGLLRLLLFKLLLLDVLVTCSGLRGLRAPRTGPAQRLLPGRPGLPTLPAARLDFVTEMEGRVAESCTQPATQERNPGGLTFATNGAGACKVLGEASSVTESGEPRDLEK